MGRHRLRAILLAGVVALIVVACGGPPPPPPPSGLFGDDELATATELTVTDIPAARSNLAAQANRSIDLRAGPQAGLRASRPPGTDY